MGHSQYENVASNVLDGMKRLFDPSKNHLSVWVWILNLEHLGYHARGSYRSERPKKARASPLHYAALFNMHNIATFLIVEHSQDINALDSYDEETPLNVSTLWGHVEITRVLLERGADIEAPDRYYLSPLKRAIQNRDVELVQVLLEYGADANAWDKKDRRTPLYFASGWGDLAIIRALQARSRRESPNRG